MRVEHSSLSSPINFKSSDWFCLCMIFAFSIRSFLSYICETLSIFLIDLPFIIWFLLFDSDRVQPLPPSEPILYVFFWDLKEWWLSTSKLVVWGTTSLFVDLYSIWRLYENILMIFKFNYTLTSNFYYLNIYTGIYSNRSSIEDTKQPH